MMKWHFAAPFMTEHSGAWLDKYVNSERHEFRTILAKYSHDRSRSSTDSSGWADYIEHAQRTWNAAAACRSPAGIITCFPQLPLVVGIRSRMSTQEIPTLAWSFNIGTLPTGLKRIVAKTAFKGITRFVVHSRREIETVSECLQIPKSRLEYVPLQRPITDIDFLEDVATPYIISMGSAGRDYRLLFEALAPLKVKTIVVAAPHAVRNLEIPDFVEMRSGVSIQECHRLLQQARLSVTPIANDTTASGQVTFLDAMRFGRPQIVTACAGSVDYIEHDVDGLLVEPGDPAAMREAIGSLWENDALRRRLGKQGRLRMQQEFSDEAAAARLVNILDELSGKTS